MNYEEMKMKLTSKAFIDGRIKDSFGNLGPAEKHGLSDSADFFDLEWDDVPKGTKSFALIFIDYENHKDEGVPVEH